jgi:DNA-binding CsgD family transcriptional regulator
LEAKKPNKINKQVKSNLTKIELVELKKNPGNMPDTILQLDDVKQPQLSSCLNCEYSSDKYCKFWKRPVNNTVNSCDKNEAIKIKKIRKAWFRNSSIISNLKEGMSNLKKPELEKINTHWEYFLKDKNKYQLWIYDVISSKYPSAIGNKQEVEFEVYYKLLFELVKNPDIKTFSKSYVAMFTRYTCCNYLGSVYGRYDILKETKITSDGAIITKEKTEKDNKIILIQPVSNSYTPDQIAILNDYSVFADKNLSKVNLTTLQKMIIRMPGEGYRDKEIAKILKINAKNIKYTRSNIKKKLNLLGAKKLIYLKLVIRKPEPSERIKKLVKLFYEIKLIDSPIIPISHIEQEIIVSPFPMIEKMQTLRRYGVNKINWHYWETNEEAVKRGGSPPLEEFIITKHKDSGKPIGIKTGVKISQEECFKRAAQKEPTEDLKFIWFKKQSFWIYKPNERKQLLFKSNLDYFDMTRKFWKLQRQAKADI